MRRPGLLRRGLERMVRALLPGPVAGLILRDLEEGYRGRAAAGTNRAADRWYTRQLLLTLSPSRLLALRRLNRGAGEPSPRPWRSLAHLAGDMRYSLRLLLKSPAMSALTIAVTAGGLGVSVFTYSMLNSMMLKPLPLPQGDRIVRVMAVAPDGRSNLLDAVDLQPIRESVRSLELVGVWESEHRLLRGGATPRAIFVELVDPQMFAVAATPAFLGRTLLAADAQPGAEPVVVLGYHLWQGEFGGDAGILDRVVELSGVATRIVGVMPEGFGFPVWASIWQALPGDALRYVARGERFPNAFARLAPGATAAQADAELHAIMQRWRREQPLPDDGGEPPAVSARVLAFPVAQMGDEAHFVFVILNLAASSILLLACINVGNLLVSRAVERGRETTIRVALGAPRWRLVLQMMGESTIIAMLGGAIALWIADRGLRWLDGFMRSIAPDGRPFWYTWGLDLDTVLAAGAFVLATIVLTGGIPAWRATRAATDAVLRDGARGTLGSGAGRVTRALVVVQVAVIAVLMFLGGTSAYLTQVIADIDFGMDTDGVLVSTVGLPEDRYLTDEARLTFFARLQRELEQQAPVAAVVLRSGVADGMGRGSEIAIDGERYGSPLMQPRAAVTAVAGDLGTIGVRLVSGRLLALDGPGDGRSALVSETLAREQWPGRSPIGQRLRLGDASRDSDWYTVVGVVSDVVVGNPFSRDRHARSVYVPLAAIAPRSASAVFRHAGDSRAAVLALHATVEAIDATVLPGRIVDFDEMFQAMGRMTALATRVLAACFGFAMLLAVTGIYGLTSRSVVQRTQEIGIRRALGATEGRVVRLFLRHGGRQLVQGLGIALVVGAIASVAASRLLDMNPMIYVVGAVAVPAIITAIVLLAIYIPTRRAVRLEPSAALWHE